MFTSAFYHGLPGAILGLAAGFAPGPILALVITQSLRFGSREGIKVAFAPLVTDAPIVALSLLVLSAFSGFETILGGVSLAGAAFVAYLAYDSFRASTPEAGSPGTGARSVRRGVMLNVLNPHVYVFWLTVGAPSVVRAWRAHPIAALAFIAAFYVCLVGAKTTVALAVGRSRTFLTGRRYRILMRALAIMLAALACRLAWNGWRFILPAA